ncbi:dephospho-CoA kinase [Rhodoligotrophos defluvii]|uniref:dephospho-CoA kinase n=1 Tax=Rhodoligotrophos defluvii TaxID=2561934 RepID=UPI0010C9C994|nr:dephospho-CoA kinase [Rhodoligotrophos defluvii]
MIKIGLTGSIAMGKSATADMFRRLGIPVFDADAVVHELYRRGGEAVAPVAALFPEAVTNGAVDRTALGKAVLGDEAKIKALEAIVHPLVRAREAAFLLQAENAGEDLVVLDIPLLFESGQHGRVDCIVVVSAPAEVQRQRALARPGMTESKLQAIRARQLPDEEKRARADFVVDSSRGLDDAFEQVRSIVATLRRRMAGEVGG